MRPCHRLCLVPLIFALAIAAGCGKSDDKKAATQVAAKVNSDEITVHQINNVLARAPNVTPEVAERAKREILDKLIDQQLARQRAIEKKLDRSPNVLQVIEAAKTEILARAYLEQITADQPKPTPEEAKKYYAEHPELFARRRVFNLEEIVVAPKEGIAAALREQVAKARSLQEIAAWLKSQGVQFAENRSVRAAEQIPLELLPRLAAMKDGEIRQIEGGGRLYVFRVVSTQLAPVDEATATARIQQFLFNQRSSEAIAKEMKQVKDKAKIQYVGEFAGSPPSAGPKPAVQAEPLKPEAKAEPTKPEAKAGPAAQAEDSNTAQPLAPNIEKGVRGLR